MNRNMQIILAGIGLAIIVLAVNSLYVVDQRRQAIVLRLGDPDRTVNAAGQADAGLQVKLPFLETVVFLDRQNQALEVDGQDIRAADQQHLVIDAIVRYRITDPLAYQRSLGDDQGAHARLERLVSGALRERLGAVKAGDFITGAGASAVLQTRDDLAARVKTARMGLQIIDVSIKHFGLPVADQAAVFARMKAQRQGEIAQIKAQGDQDSAAVRAAGDRDAAIVVATAQADAGKVRGDGDAKRAALYAETFGKDPQFADFYRSMKAYDKTLGGGDATLVLSTDNAFLKYFKNGPGR